MIRIASSRSRRQLREEVLSHRVEYAYYATVFYGIMGVAWGISVPNLAAGMLAVIAAYCVSRFGHDIKTILEPISLPLGCALSFLLIQIFVHNQSLLDVSLRSFFSWICSLVIIQSLNLRPGFLRRFSLALLGLLLALIPNLTSLEYGEISRAGLDPAVGLGHPNSLAAWFGFSAVYYVIKGIESKRLLSRTVSFLIALMSLFVVGLTVSRGTLFAVTMAIMIALRRVLKGAFIPAMMLVGLGWIVYQAGLFDGILASYTHRGTEETGRFLIWPAAIERFLNSPWIGVGASDVGSYIFEKGSFDTPHNSFIYVGLASGVIPLIFFIGYWIRAARSALRAVPARLEEAPFRLPLLVFTLLIAMAGDDAFKTPWAIVALSTAIGLRANRQVRKVRKDPFGSEQPAPQFNCQEPRIEQSVRPIGTKLNSHL